MGGLGVGFTTGYVADISKRSKYNIIQYNNTLLILKKEIQLSAFNN